MQIKPNEIAEIEDAGILDGSPVKLLKTKGGFWIAISKLKGKLKEEALAAGSHPAIVKFNLEKQFSTFQPALMKSEIYNNANVDKHSHFLSEELRKSGHDIYSIQEGNEITFHVTKHNMNVSTVHSSLENNELVIKDLNIDKQFVRGLAGATTEKAIELKANKIKMDK